MSGAQVVYLAGPMTGIPAFNFPAFDAAAADLRARGLKVISPAELDDADIREAALASPDGATGSGSLNGETWGDFLARDVKLVADRAEGVVVLEGWERSRGARLETYVARLCGKPVLSYPELEPVAAATLDAAHVGMAPTGEVRVVNAATGGEKGMKPQRMELLPFDVLMRDVAPLYAAGAAKYQPHNWRKGYDWSLSFGAMMRHAALWWSRQDVDEETGCPHMAAVVFHALALLYFAHAHPDLDDRAA